MPDYVREQSVGELLRNGVSIYRRNFLAVFATYFIVCFPLAWLYMEAVDQEAFGLALSLLLVNLVAVSLATGALTILVSDMCLGNAVSVARAYKSLGATRLAKVFATSMLFVVGFLFLIFLGRLLYVSFPGAPIVGLGAAAILATGVGLVLSASLLTTVPVMVLENRGGIAAIGRSWGLSSGLRGRNLQVFMFLLAVAIALTVVILTIAMIVFEIIAERSSSAVAHAIQFTNAVFLSTQFLVMPLLLVVIILLYYDSRVRHEGYDKSALGEDLHH
jgi:hypothetical protein